MNPASQTPNHGQNPSGINVDVDDVFRSFGSLGFGTDGTFGQGVDASSPGSYHSQDEDAAANYRNQWFQRQQTSDESQTMETPRTCENPAADQDRVLDFHYNPITFGESYTSDAQNHGQGSLKGPVDYRNWYSHSGAPQDFGAGTSTGQPTMSSFCRCPPMPNFVNRSPFLLPDLGFAPMGRYTFESDRFRGNMNSGLCSDYSRWNQEGKGPGGDLKWVQETLKWGNYEQKERVISVLKGCIFRVMTDKKISLLFPSLIDACEDEQLDSIVGDIFSESELFIYAAFCHPGANSIVKLIGKLKKSHVHAFTMTQILSTRFLDIATHPIARNVMKQCLIFFGPEPKKVLYEKAIDHFNFLATHDVGCISLNDCINTISGEHKDMLLDKVAEVSDYLSNDPFGNFVVQTVLPLRNMRVTAKILNCLKGQFVHLSQKKGGSHVIERCMDSCNLGLTYVVEEIVKTPKAPLLLAQDQFGNYIIQKALKMTKESGFYDLHYSLVECLEPYRRELIRTKGGRNIIPLLT